MVLTVQFQANKGHECNHSETEMWSLFFSFV